MSGNTVKAKSYSVDELRLPDPSNSGEKLLYPIFFMLGVGSLFPWNAFINAQAYYATRFCGTSRADDFLSFFGVTFNIASVACLCCCVRYGWKQVVAPLVIYALVFVITDVLVLVPDVDPTFLFVFTLVSLAVVGVCTALLSGGIFGLAAIFPPIYTQAIMSGQGLAGVAISLVSIATTWAAAPAASSSCSPSGDDGDDSSEDQDCTYSVDWATFSYFAVAVVTLLACVVCYGVLDRLPITQYYRQKAAQDKPSEGGRAEEDSFAVEPLLANSADGGYSSSSKSSSGRKIGDVLRAVSSPAFSVFFVFMVTLAIFPSITTKILSSQNCVSTNRFYNDLWIPFSFLMFNAFDFIGRSLPAFVPPPKSPSSLVFMSLSRIVFFFLFLLCNVDGTVLPVVFSNDAFPVLIMLFFALSNGCVSSYCMMAGPQLVSANDQTLAGNIMILLLTLGLFCGSAFSFVCIKVSTGVW